ncbi:thiol reductant ABC exporter subunit CydD [Caulobacter sp. UNC279MFTsu5.1]|uniref:thiol reductant ABC exporter subunit CydD n=1 Tax=Caulobacter sp. UNC279MFTsu5.1 TaxID=1502775 RepID=UPI0008F28AB5|nr:thiol reductant ABC exporter subunit CydD [Caulobacter sp. UNC279MFTsu5.1]SFJ11936.1 ATP-binding cassette, subfamily C, CydD [Caulobacter sp. UNC279MFTsu5.1]
MSASLTAQLEAVARPWLKASARSGGRASSAASLWLLADVPAAIAFAAGLALAIDALPRGLAAAGPWLVVLALAAAARGLLARRAAEAGARAAASVKAQARHDAVASVLGGRVTGGEALSAVVEGVEALDGHVARFEPARRAAAVAPLLLIAAIAVATPVAAGILLATLVPFGLVMALAGGAAAEESRRQFLALERLSGLFLDRVRALPLVLAFQAEGAVTRDLSVAADDLARRTIRVLRVAFLSSGALEFFAALSVALVAVYCGFNLLRLLPFPVPEQLDLKRAFFALALAPEVYAPLRRLAAAYHDRQAAEAAALTLAALPAPAPAPPAAAFGAPPALRFQAVTVSYEAGEAPVLDGFDLDIAPGEVVALLGPSGSGKTTLLNLLLGLAPLSGGEVSIGDQRLSHLGSIAASVAWAGQSPVILPGTLADNLALAYPGADREAIQRAARAVGLDAVLDDRGGLDTRLDERGAGLSGGERRRLGLARALLKPAPILLLDEPTADLDAASEQALLPILREAAHGRTTLIATHSEIVAALADRVVRL